MNDDPERLFRQLRPRGAPPSLRDRTLAAVANELGATATSLRTWERLAGRLVAAALVLGVAWNLWALRSSEQQLAKLATAKPTPSSVAQTVESVQSVAGLVAAETLSRQLSWFYENRRYDRPVLKRRLEQFLRDLNSSS